MGYTPRYDNGDWNTICDVCGRQYKASQLKQRWDGLKTCSDDWEPRQPQDFVRGVADTQAPAWTRPEQADSFQPIEYIYDPDGNLPILPVLVQSNPVLIALINRLRDVVATTVTSSASMTRTSIPRPVTYRTVNGYAVNTVTLG